MDINKLKYNMGTPFLVLAAYITIASFVAIVLSVISLDAGAPAYTRIGIGLVGLLAVVLLILQVGNGRAGWLLALAWAAIQVPYYATEPGQPYTSQAVEVLVGSTTTSVSGTASSYSAIGINVVGLVLLIAASALKGRLELWDRRVKYAASSYAQ